MLQLNQLFEDLAEQVIVQEAAVTAAQDQTQHVVSFRTRLSTISNIP